MKTLKCTAVLVAFVGLLLAGCTDDAQSPVAPGDQSVQAPTPLQKNTIKPSNIRPFTGYEYAVSLASPGETFLADGKQIVKGIQYTTRFEATFKDGKPDLLTGNGFLELYQVLDMQTFEGYATGKLVVTPDNKAAGGVWEIGWFSKAFLAPDPKEPTKMVLTYPGKWVGYGKGGAINGMQLYGDDIIKFDPANPLGWYGDGGRNCFVVEYK